MDNTLDAADLRAGFGRFRWVRRISAALTSTAANAQSHSLPSQRISARATLRHANLLGSRIDCLGGHVWITFDGDCRDVVLRKGQSLLVDRQTPVLIHALTDSSTRVVRSQAKQSSAELASKTCYQSRAPVGVRHERSLKNDRLAT